VRFAGLRTVAFDGCNSVKVPGIGRNRSWLGRIRYRWALPGMPRCGLTTLAETGTHGLPGAALGSAADRDEAAVARRLRPGMLVLLHRAFDASAFLGEVAAAGAMLLARSKSTRHPAVLGYLPDGSYLPCLDGLQVWIIEASLTMTGADGSRVRDGYQLITTLMDHGRFPAAVRLYHERWVRHEAHCNRVGVRNDAVFATWILEYRGRFARPLVYKIADGCMSCRRCPARHGGRDGQGSVFVRVLGCKLGCTAA
jgi:hypothetical protein